jgi:hypothetical protein
MNLHDLRFGIEIETVGQTRGMVAEAIKFVVGGTISQHNNYGPYEVAYHVEDLAGRTWKVVHDGSLISVPSHLRAEVVSPVLTYADIDTLQQVVRQIRVARAKVDARCGIHIHVDAAPFEAKQIANLAKLVYKQEPLILHALGISPERLRSYTKPIDPAFITKLEQQRPKTKDDLNILWYGRAKPNPTHYDDTRYYGVNLHNVWYRGTVEFRWFEATLHAGKIKSYVQLVLAIAAKALNARSAASAKREFDPASAKYDFRVFLLRLGMIGAEFKTARKFLLENMPGNGAWKHGRPQPTIQAQALAA